MVNSIVALVRGESLRRQDRGQHVAVRVRRWRLVIVGEAAALPARPARFALVGVYRLARIVVAPLLDTLPSQRDLEIDGLRASATADVQRGTRAATRQNEFPARIPGGVACRCRPSARTYRPSVRIVVRAEMRAVT
jgi:hypothetical protein